MASPIAPDTEPLRVVTAPPPRRRRRLVRRAILALAVLAVLACALVIAAGLVIRSSLQDGRSALAEGRRELLAGDVTGARVAFERAQSTFTDAQGASNGVLVRLGAAVPILGNNLRVAQGAAEAGKELATAGEIVASALTRLPQGIGSLAPEGGRIPLEALEDLAGPVAQAADHARTAQERIEATPSSYLLGSVDEDRRDALEQVEQVARAFAAADDVLAGMPSFAGADGPRRYFLAALNPAELRAGGGLMGAYSILTIDDGRLSLSSFRPVQALRDLPPGRVPPPNPDFRRNYDQYGGAGYWLNMNMTPDFPSASRAILDTYRLGEGERLDGVIAADPFALAALLRVTGATEVDGLGRLDANRVVPFVTNEAYSRFDTQAERKAALGRVAGGVLARFLESDADGVRKVRAIVEAAGAGHLHLFSTDPVFEGGLEEAGVAGAFGAEEGADLLGVSVNAGAGSKVDFYATRTVDHVVELAPDGRAVETTTVTIHNDAPTSGEPRYVLGPQFPWAEAGDNIPLLTVSCPQRCELLHAERNGEPRALRIGSELDTTWYQDYFTIPSGEAGTLVVQTEREDVWSGNDSAGVYQLDVAGQTTINPTSTRVEIHAPSGTDITWTNVPMEVDGGVAVWEGEAEPTTALEIAFRAPAPLRWWRNAARALS